MIDKLEQYSENLASGKTTALTYRERTLIERELFQVVAQFTRAKLGSEFSSFSRSALEQLVAQREEKGWKEEDLNVVIKAHNVQQLMAGLSSSDPYWVDEVEAELGGKGNALSNLGREITDFVELHKLRTSQ